MKVAIVHYWLVNMRGGEKVIEALLEIYPKADIYTHVYNSKSISPLINSKRIFTSKINKLPFSKKIYQLYMPLMPNALMDFNLHDYDLVISSESGPAKGVVPNPNAFHICYCHSPMRYLWDMYHNYFRKTNPIVRFFMKRLIPNLRFWDITSANLVDCFIANSNYVSNRINRYYNRRAVIINPPVNIEKYLNIERKPADDLINGCYLFFGQLTGYKRADIAIEACLKSGRRLIVAGAGKIDKTTKKLINKYSKRKDNVPGTKGEIYIKGRVTDEELIVLYTDAKALLFPGIEDFGIIPVEANAAGCPVIAFREGGATETVKENVTGLFFDEQTPDSLIQAMDKFESMIKSFNNRDSYTEHVKQFSLEVFRKKISTIIENRERI